MPTTRWTTLTSLPARRSHRIHSLSLYAQVRMRACAVVRVRACVRAVVRVRSAQKVRVCGRRATSCTERRRSRPRRSRTRRLVTSTSSPSTTSRGSPPPTFNPPQCPRVSCSVRVVSCCVACYGCARVAQATLDPLDAGALRQGYGSANLYTLLADSHVALTQLEKVRHHPELFSASCVVRVACTPCLLCVAQSVC